MPQSTLGADGAPLCLNGYSLENVVPFINWNDFFYRWDLSAKTPPAGGGETGLVGGAGKTDKAREEARRALKADAQELISVMRARRLPELRGVVRFVPALSRDETVFLYPAEGGERELSFPRCRRAGIQSDAGSQARAGAPAHPSAANPCLADFILPQKEARGRFDTLGFFALSAGFGLDALTDSAPGGSPDYRAILAASLADTLAEAWSAQTHARFCSSGIRPAFGYPCCPDHAGKRFAFELLDAERLCGLSLTETAMIQPAASVCGMYFLHPQSFYFSV